MRKYFKLPSTVLIQIAILYGLEEYQCLYIWILRIWTLELNIISLLSLSFKNIKNKVIFYIVKI